MKINIVEIEHLTEMFSDLEKYIIEKTEKHIVAVEPSVYFELKKTVITMNKAPYYYLGFTLYYNITEITSSVVQDYRIIFNEDQDNELKCSINGTFVELHKGIPSLKLHILTVIRVYAEELKRKTNELNI